MKLGQWSITVHCLPTVFPWCFVVSSVSIVKHYIKVPKSWNFPYSVWKLDLESGHLEDMPFQTRCTIDHSTLGFRWDLGLCCEYDSWDNFQPMGTQPKYQECFVFFCFFHRNFSCVMTSDTNLYALKQRKCFNSNLNATKYRAWKNVSHLYLPWLGH